jgi:hypothetical protein
MIFDVIKKFGQQCKEEKGTKTEARLFLGAPHTATDAINGRPSSSYVLQRCVWKRLFSVVWLYTVVICLLLAQ